MTTVELMRMMRHRGQPKVSRAVTLTAAAYDPIRMRNAVRDPNRRKAVDHEVGGMEGRSRIKRSPPRTRT